MPPIYSRVRPSTPTVIATAAQRIAPGILAVVLATTPALAGPPTGLRVVPGGPAGATTLTSAPHVTIQCPCLRTAGYAPLAAGHRTDCAGPNWNAPHVTVRRDDVAPPVCGCTWAPTIVRNTTWYEAAPAPWNIYGCVGRKHPRTLIRNIIINCSNPHCH